MTGRPVSVACFCKRRSNSYSGRECGELARSNEVNIVHFRRPAFTDKIIIQMLTMTRLDVAHQRTRLNKARRESKEHKTEGDCCKQSEWRWNVKHDGHFSTKSVCRQRHVAVPCVVLLIFIMQFSSTFLFASANPGSNKCLHT